MKKRHGSIEKCPVCGTVMKNAMGIGPYCPKKSCPVTDDADRWRKKV